MSKESLVLSLLKMKKNPTGPKTEQDILGNEDEKKQLLKQLNAEPLEVAEAAIDVVFTEEDFFHVSYGNSYQHLTAREYLKSLLNH